MVVSAGYHAEVKKPRRPPVAREYVAVFKKARTATVTAPSVPNIDTAAGGLCGFRQFNLPSSIE